MNYRIAFQDALTAIRGLAAGLSSHNTGTIDRAANVVGPILSWFPQSAALWTVIRNGIRQGRRADSPQLAPFFRTLQGRLSDVEGQFSEVFPSDTLTIDDLLQAGVDSRGVIHSAVKEVCYAGPNVSPGPFDDPLLQGGFFTFEDLGQTEVLFHPALIVGMTRSLPIHTTILDWEKPNNFRSGNPPPTWDNAREFFGRLASLAAVTVSDSGDMKSFSYQSGNSSSLVSLNTSARTYETHMTLSFGGPRGSDETQWLAHYPKNSGRKIQTVTAIDSARFGLPPTVSRLQWIDHRFTGTNILSPHAPQFLYMVGSVWEIYGDQNQFFNPWFQLGDIKIESMVEIGKEMVANPGLRYQIPVGRGTPAIPFELKVSPATKNEAGLPLHWRMELTGPNGAQQHVRIDSIALEPKVLDDIEAYIKKRTHEGLGPIN